MVKSKIHGLAPMLAVAAALLIALGAPAQDQISPLKVREGGKAPNFALKDGDGKTVRLSDFKGHAVLLDFYRGYW